MRRVRYDIIELSSTSSSVDVSPSLGALSEEHLCSNTQSEPKTCTARNLLKLLSLLITGTVLTLLVLSLWNPFADANSEFAPEQVHIAAAQTPDTITFTYQTWDYPVVTTANVRIGVSASTLDRTVRGETFLFTDPNPEHLNRTMHVVQVSNLKASTRYYYQVGDDQYGWSKQVFSFKTLCDARTLRENLPQKFIIYGDLGVDNDQTLPSIVEEAVTQSNTDIVIHLGDLAYDLHSDQGRLGDLFMQQLQAVAAYVPYMVCAGNHEIAFNFSHITQRFRGQPSNEGSVQSLSGGLENNWYYSWNAGLVHFVAINTETYFYHPHLIEQQYRWLEQDLIAANKNRTKAPWVIVYGHRGLYCSSLPLEYCREDTELLRNGISIGTSSSPQRYEFGLERLFYDQGVDFYFAGHKHSYERTYDVYNGTSNRTTRNMPATTYVISGGTGVYGKESFDAVQPEWSATRSSIYSYSRFYVYNESCVRLQQVVSDTTIAPDRNHRVLDDVWYIQQHHGPFALQQISRNNHGQSNPLHSGQP